MKRVQAGWNGWRKVSGAICDNRMPTRVSQIPRLCVQTYPNKGYSDSADLVAVPKATGMDRNQNDSFRGMAQVVQFGERTGDKIVSKLCRKATVEKYTIFQF